MYFKNVAEEKAGPVFNYWFYLICRENPEIRSVRKSRVWIDTLSLLLNNVRRNLGNLKRNGVDVMLRLKEAALNNDYEKPKNIYVHLPTRVGISNYEN